MKTLFIIKYIGKTFLILCAVLAMGRIAKLHAGFNIVAIVGASAYCFGSVEYQSRLRNRKKVKTKL